MAKVNGLAQHLAVHHRNIPEGVFAWGDRLFCGYVDASRLFGSVLLLIHFLRRLVSHLRILPSVAPYECAKYIVALIGCRRQGGWQQSGYLVVRGRGEPHSYGLRAGIWLSGQTALHERETQEDQFDEDRGEQGPVELSWRHCGDGSPRRQPSQGKQDCTQRHGRTRCRACEPSPETADPCGSGSLQQKPKAGRWPKGSSPTHNRYGC